MELNGRLLKFHEGEGDAVDYLSTSGTRRMKESTVRCSFSL